jgi:hypothetical protein
MLYKFLSALIASTVLFASCSADEMSTGNYNVSSNCPGAATNGQLDIKKSTNYSTSSYDYDVKGATTFGFPSDKWTRKSHVLTSSSSERSCNAVVSGTKASEAAFKCGPVSSDQSDCLIVVKGL